MDAMKCEGIRKDKIDSMIFLIEQHEGWGLHFLR